MTAPRIELDHVTKRFGEHVAVDDVSLAIPAGQYVCLVGASGSGKTTTLKCLNRLVEPDGGRILVDGTDVTRTDPVALRRTMGWAIQKIGLFPHRTVADNVALVPRLLGHDAERVRTRVDELLDLVGLPPSTYRDRLPAALSGGQRQRVGVARALAHHPRILLLDEPYGALDALTRQQLRDDVRALHDDLGLTTVMVTHDLTTALAVADRVLVMHRGRVQRDASPRDLWNDPRDAAELLAVPRAQADFLAGLGA